MQPVRETLTEIEFVSCKYSGSELYFHYVLHRVGKGERMSKKNVIVSNVAEGHDNPIAELVQVACKFDSDIILEAITVVLMRKALWVSWLLIHLRECLLTLLQKEKMNRKHW